MSTKRGGTNNEKNKKQKRRTTKTKKHKRQTKQKQQNKMIIKIKRTTQHRNRKNKIKNNTLCNAPAHLQKTSQKQWCFSFF